MSFKRYVFGLAMLAAGAAHAQSAGVVTLRANQTSGTGSVTPVLTWSTNPAAASCQASGGWTGAKAASGTQTLPAITTSANYTLTCSWGGDRAVLNWTAPARNTDGSVLNDLTGFNVVYGTSSTTLDRTMVVNDVTARTTTVTSLTPGTWYFAVRARNSRSLESDNSNVAQATVTSSSASGTAAITVGSTPPTTPPPTTPPPGTGLRTINATVYDLTDSDINVAVGTIALGRPCDASLTVRNIYYKVTSSEVTFTRTPRTRAVVARCAR